MFQQYLLEVLKWIQAQLTSLSPTPMCKHGCELKLFFDNSLINNPIISGETKNLMIYSRSSLHRGVDVLAELGSQEK